MPKVYKRVAGFGIGHEAQIRGKTAGSVGFQGSSRAEKGAEMLHHATIMEADPQPEDLPPDFCDISVRVELNHHGGPTVLPVYPCIDV
jgi:hypothetical protein